MILNPMDNAIPRPHLLYFDKKKIKKTIEIHSILIQDFDCEQISSMGMSSYRLCINNS